MARLAPNVLVEDGTVPRTQLPAALKGIKDIAAQYGLKVALLFHAGDGNLHPQIICDERNIDQTRRVREAGHKMLKVCVDVGGTISGEHGIGIDKREAMKWQFNRETLSLFRRLKNVFDPQNLCNPEKKVPLVSKGQLQNQTGDEVKELNPLGVETPADEAALLKIIHHAAKHHRQIGIQGSKTKMKVKENMVINMALLNKVVDFDPGNLTVTAQGGASIDVVRKHVEGAGLYLWVAGEGTVGGVIATRSSVLPPLRDIILGMRVLLPTGEIVVFGGKTMKNVAGYDATKLLIGSWGTLGVILDVTFRLFPTNAPELKFEKPKPFIFRDIHKAIKKAFDPGEIMSQRMMLLTEDDIRKIASTTKEDMKREFDSKDYHDRHWIS